MRPIFPPIIVIGIGLLFIAAAAFDWDWFMENRRPQFFTSFLGRNGERVFYICMGVALILLALAVY